MPEHSGEANRVPTNQRSAIPEGTDDKQAAPAEQSEPPERPRIISTSPIDDLPEGKVYRMALEAIDHGDLSVAEKYRLQLSTHPTYGVLAQAIEAVLLAESGRYDAAMRLATQISTVPIMKPESYMVAADVFRSQGRWSDAIGCLNNAVALNPGLARGHRWLGILYYDLGAMQQATEHLRLAGQINPDDYGVLRLAARIHSEYQNFPEAVVDCRTALQRQPPEPVATEIRLRLADSLRQLRQFDEAVEVIAECPASAAVWTCRAQCWESAGDIDRAQQACEQALKLDPEDAVGNLVQGRILLAQRNAASAIEFLQRAVDRNPGDHEARFLLGRSLILAGRTDEGKVQVARSTELKNLFLEMADLHIQAIDHPQDPDIRLKLAQLSQSGGKPEIAAMWYRAVLGLDPENSEALQAMKELGQ